MNESEQRIKEIAGYLLIPLVLGLCSAHIPSTLAICRAQSTMGYSFIPYLLYWANCIAWIVFSIHRGWRMMYEPLFVNVYGLVINSIVLFVYWWYIKDPILRRDFHTKVAAMSFVMGLLSLLSFFDDGHDCISDPNSFSCWWGKITIVTNSLIFVGPFTVFGKVWATKSVEFLPFTPCLAGCIASTDCVVYFYMLNDLNGLIPNFAGAVLSAVQLALYAYIVVFYPQGSETDKSSAVQLQESTTSLAHSG